MICTFTLTGCTCWDGSWPSLLLSWCHCGLLDRCVWQPEPSERWVSIFHHLKSWWCCRRLLSFFFLFKRWMFPSIADCVTCIIVSGIDYCVVGNIQQQLRMAFVAFLVMSKKKMLFVPAFGHPLSPCWRSSLAQEKNWRRWNNCRTDIYSESLAWLQRLIKDKLQLSYSTQAIV